MAAIDNNPLSQNFAIPQNWIFNLKRAPSLSYFCQKVKLPDIDFHESDIGTPFLNIPFGGDHATFTPIELTFKVDQNFQNWQEILNWGWGISNPTGDSKVYNILEHNPKTSPYTLTSDLSIFELDSLNNPIIVWTFENCRPLYLTGPTYDSTITDQPCLTSMVTFKYVKFNINIWTGTSSGSTNFWSTLKT